MVIVVPMIESGLRTMIRTMSWVNMGASTAVTLMGEERNAEVNVLMTILYSRF